MHPAVAAFRRRHYAFARQAIPGAGDRMTGKRQFARRREDAQASRHALFIRGQHEHGFGKIHLARDLLHLFVGDPFCFRKHGERIAGKGAVGEYIELNEIVLGHWLVTLSVSRSGVSVPGAVATGSSDS
jgi:hypothetical protein